MLQLKGTSSRFGAGINGSVRLFPCSSSLITATVHRGVGNQALSRADRTIGKVAFHHVHPKVLGVSPLAAAAFLRRGVGVGVAVAPYKASTIHCHDRAIGRSDPSGRLYLQRFFSTDTADRPVSALCPSSSFAWPFSTPTSPHLLTSLHLTSSSYADAAAASRRRPDLSSFLSLGDVSTSFIPNDSTSPCSETTPHGPARAAAPGPVRFSSLARYTGSPAAVLLPAFAALRPPRTFLLSPSVFTPLRAAPLSSPHSSAGGSASIAPRRYVAAAAYPPSSGGSSPRGGSGSGGSGGGGGGARRFTQNMFTEKAWQAIVAAPELAKESQQQVVEVEHLLKALLEQPNGLARRVLSKAGCDPSRTLERVNTFVQRQARISGDVQQVLGRHLESLISTALDLSQRWGDSFCSAEHLLLAAAEDTRCGQQLLTTRPDGVAKEKIEQAIKEIRGSNKVMDQDPEAKYEALSKYARDLTQAARDGKLDPVIGRDDEIRRCIQILSRRTKNNPVLIGEPGVGKTAVAEGLAQRIVAGDVPEALKGRTLMALDLGALVAGAKYRGEFEDRVKAVTREVTGSGGQVVLFIDEIHTIVGAGATSGAMDASNLLKPLLARGELRCIGATTLDEYRKYIEKDPALERRFQQVLVSEPSVAATVSVLRGLRERYELHHGVRISDGALLEAAALSDRYIADRFLPDKAIDLIDEAAAKLKMEITSKPLPLDEIDRRVIQLEMERLSVEKAANKDKTAAARLESLDAELARLKRRQQRIGEQWRREKMDMARVRDVREEIERVNLEVQQAEREYNLNRAAELKYGTLMELQKKLKAAEEALLGGGSAPSAGGDGSESDDDFGLPRGKLLKEEVTEADVAEVVSKWTGIPVSRLQQTEREKLLRLEDELHKRVVGQEEAVTAIAAAIQRSRAGLSDPNKPIASFMFMGPSGVGKTELAKALAAFLFSTEDAMVRIDMSEYMEKHAVSRLIGAPPGYVGYDEGGQLTEAVRRRPYAVVLFDEIEKAHGDVFNVLLQVLDDGRVTDSQGHIVSFKNTIIILTSNLGSRDMLELAAAGADRDRIKSTAMASVRSHFRPEFVNRIDEFITFDPLSQRQVNEIVKLQVRRVADRVAEKKIKLTLTDVAIEYLGRIGYDPLYGARPVKRAIQQELETSLARALLKGDIGEEDSVEVDCDEEGSKLVIRKLDPVPPAPEPGSSAAFPSSSPAKEEGSPASVVGSGKQSARAKGGLFAGGRRPGTSGSQ